MIRDGVISFVPSQAKPPQGFANVCDEIPAWYVPGEMTPKSTLPSSAEAAVFTTWLFASRSCTVTPGRPSSPFSTFPGTPPPGLKSRQTTPSM